MDEEEKIRAYSEIVEILKLIEDEEKLEKIPFEIIEMIKNNSDPTYKPQISKDIPLSEQNLSKTTFGILGWLSSKYWEDGEDIENKEDDDNNKEEKDNENDKQEIEEKNDENKKVEPEEEEEKVSAIVYSDLEPDFLEKIESIGDNTNLPIVINKLNFYEKMIIKIMHFLKKIFKANHENLKEGVNE